MFSQRVEEACEGAKCKGSETAMNGASGKHCREEDVEGRRCWFKSNNSVVPVSATLTLIAAATVAV